MTCHLLRATLLGSALLLVTAIVPAEARLAADPATTLDASGPAAGGIVLARRGRGADDGPNHDAGDDHGQRGKNGGRGRGRGADDGPADDSTGDDRGRRGKKGGKGRGRGADDGVI